MNHETEHARHNMHGFPNLPLDMFDMENNAERALYMCITEFVAHGTHIRALGLTKPQSFYPRKYQQFMIQEAQRYQIMGTQLFRSGQVNPRLLPLVQSNFGQLRFKAL